MTNHDIQLQKAALRKQAALARRRQADKDSVSAAICRRLASLPSFQSASVVLMYVDVRDEVRTRGMIADLLQVGDKRVIVPYCVGDRLHLFRLEAMRELIPGAFGILEPAEELKMLPGRTINPDQLDLVVAPGVAFDLRGSRLGHGKGYYDRLLEAIPPTCIIAALAYDAQIFPHLPSQPHDIPMHYVLTETRTIDISR